MPTATRLETSAITAVVVTIAVAVAVLHVRDQVDESAGLALHQWRAPTLFSAVCDGGKLYYNTTCIKTCALDALASSLPDPTADPPPSAAAFQRVSCHGCADVPPGHDNALWTWFQHRIQDLDAWSDVLDAGTGPTSYQWLARSAAVTRITAVTADPGMARRVAALPGFVVRPQDILLTGSWHQLRKIGAPLADRRFSLILADYLIGSMDAYSPFVQDQLWDTLAGFLQPDGYLLITGQQPYAMRRDSEDILVDDASAGEETRDQQLARAVFQLRDAAQVAIGLRYYREFPLSWYQRSLQRSGFRIQAVERFPIAWSAASLAEQLDVIDARVKQAMAAYPSDMMADGSTTRQMYQSLLGLSYQLRRRVAASRDLASPGLCFLYDFAIIARRVDQRTE